MRTLRFSSPTPPLDWAILRGWILYDGTCGLCSQTADRWRARLLRRGFVFVSSTTDAIERERRGLPAVELSEMRLITVDGQAFGGGRALGEIARHLWWAVPLSWLPRNPLTRPLTDWLYRRVAANRHWLSRWLGYEPCGDACAIRHG